MRLLPSSLSKRSSDEGLYTLTYIHLTEGETLTLRVILLLRHLRLLKFGQQPLTSLTRISAAAGAAFTHFVVKPHTPSLSANEIIFAGIEKMGDGVAGFG